jgi:hypothetical protein
LPVYGIRDEYLPREITSHLPDDPTERRWLLLKDLVTQSEDVLVDARATSTSATKPWPAAADGAGARRPLSAATVHQWPCVPEPVRRSWRRGDLCAWSLDESEVLPCRALGFERRRTVRQHESGDTMTTTNEPIGQQQPAYGAPQQYAQPQYGQAPVGYAPAGLQRPLGPIGKVRSTWAVSA